MLDRRGVECCLTVDSPLIGLDALISHMEQAVREGADLARTPDGDHSPGAGAGA